jgi:hypothetical protein
VLEDGSDMRTGLPAVVSAVALKRHASRPEGIELVSNISAEL